MLSRIPQTGQRINADSFLDDLASLKRSCIAEPMKRLALLLLVALLVCVPVNAHAWSATVTHIVDGDTITVAPLGQMDALIRVRLYGIDAPESRQGHGPEATAALAAMLPVGATADIIPMDTDKYGRTVGLVIYEGLTVNHTLVREGHAWVAPKYCRAYFCRGWMKEARATKKAGKGLWREKQAEAPWEWRKKNPTEHTP